MRLTDLLTPPADGWRPVADDQHSTQDDLHVGGDKVGSVIRFGEDSPSYGIAIVEGQAVRSGAMSTFADAAQWVERMTGYRARPCKG